MHPLGVRVLHVHISTNITSCCLSIYTASGSKQGFDFSSEEMTQSADHWISMLGLVEHPGDEDGEMVANLDSIAVPLFLNPNYDESSKLV